MVSAAALDDAETRRNNAQSDLEGAKTRTAQARQQLTRTEVRAVRWTGDGSKVSAGDTAQIGKELVKVIDPSSMRLEGLVSADNVGQIKAGQAVRFRVNGYGDQEFDGRVRRVNPLPTRPRARLKCWSVLPIASNPNWQGLYAEGRIETESADALTVPASALMRDAASNDKAEVWHVASGVLKRAAVELGERDPRSGDFAIKRGLKSGDQVLPLPIGHFEGRPESRNRIRRQTGTRGFFRRTSGQVRLHKSKGNRPCSCPISVSAARSPPLSSSSC